MRRSFPARIFGRFVSILLLPAILLAGCAGDIERSWTEEVALDHGKVVVIERYVKFKESNSLAGDAYSSTSQESRFSFTGELATLPSWNELLVPIVLYRDPATSEWVIVATTSNCDTWYERGGPVPPYWEYRLGDAKWVETKLSQASIGRRANLFFNYEPELPARRITPRMKDAIIKESNFGLKYLSVVGDLKRTCAKRVG